MTKIITGIDSMITRQSRKSNPPELIPERYTEELGFKGLTVHKLPPAASGGIIVII